MVYELLLFFNAIYALRDEFLLISDIHLDLLVDGDKYLPETFCRPEDEYVIVVLVTLHILLINTNFR